MAKICYVKPFDSHGSLVLTDVGTWDCSVMSKSLAFLRHASVQWIRNPAGTVHTHIFPIV